MVDSETKSELNYIVWQYLQKESPSLAVKFKKSKKIKPREEAEVTLFNLYDIYNRNKSDAVKRKRESEIEMSPSNKKVCLCQEENSVEDDLTEGNEKDVSGEQRNEEIDKLNQEDDNSNEKPSVNEEQKNGDKVIEPEDNKKPVGSESTENSSETKPSIKSRSNKERKKTSLSKLEKKETLLTDKLNQDDDNSNEKQSLNEEQKNGDKVIEPEDSKKPVISNLSSENSSETKSVKSGSNKGKKKNLVPEREKKKTHLDDKLNRKDNKSDEKSSSNEGKKNDDNITDPEDDKNPVVSESNLSSEESSETKPSTKSGSNKEKKKALLPKPKKKKTLLSAPFSSIHKNDPNFYNKDDRRKILLPEPSSSGSSRRKILLAEPLHKKPLLSEALLPDYPDSERIRRTLLPEPFPPLSQHRRAKMPLLMEPLPLPLLQDKTRRVDRMDLLAESPPLHPLYSGSMERVPLLSHPLESDQSDSAYRRERRPLLDGPPEHHHASRERNVGLLTSPSHNVEDDMSRKRRMFLFKQSPLLPRRECEPDADLTDYELYHRGEAGPSSRPMFSDEPEYDDSSQLYFRRSRTKEPTSEISSWEDKEVVFLTKVKNYLKKLSRSSIAERLNLLDKPTDNQDLEVRKPQRIPHPSSMSPDSYAHYLWDKNVSMTGRDQMLPESSGLIEKLMADKLAAELIKKEAVNQNEVLIRKYEEELKSIGINMTSEMSNAFRRASENEFPLPGQEIQQRLYERY